MKSVPAPPCPHGCAASKLSRFSQIDLLADDVCFKELKKCVAVCMASSEETNEEVFCSGRGYSVAFDPIDGSSIIDANWAVGSIFGVYPDPAR